MGRIKVFYLLLLVYATAVGVCFCAPAKCGLDHNLVITPSEQSCLLGHLLQILTHLVNSQTPENTKELMRNFSIPCTCFKAEKHSLGSNSQVDVGGDSLLEKKKKPTEPFGTINLHDHQGKYISKNSPFVRRCFKNAI